MTATTQRALLGCIADDFTGATDLANMLVRGGMRTVQTIAVPEKGETIEADALVVALKSRRSPQPTQSRNRLPPSTGCAPRAAASLFSNIARPSIRLTQATSGR